MSSVTPAREASGPHVAVRVRYLSAIRETSGTRMDELHLPAGATLASVAEWVKANRGIALPAPAVMSTLNGHGWSQLPAGLATEMHNGDEVALFPLLSGG
jgi:molybdopterin converting factor small subunit